MKEILQNLANLLLVEKCKKMRIDCSGSHTVYKGRFKYNLISDKTGKEIIQIAFHKSSVPTYIIF